MLKLDGCHHRKQTTRKFQPLAALHYSHNHPSSHFLFVSISFVLLAYTKTQFVHIQQTPSGASQIAHA